MSTGTMHPIGPEGPPVVLAERQPGNPHAHIVAFYECIMNGGKNPSGVLIGATAALTAILGHEAMTKERVVSWSDFGIKL